jgi:tRNA pseudouridine55 synthase
MNTKTISGFLLINKPQGITSYEVVKKIKKITGIKKVGHSGVLDPFASGLLIIGINREATKKLNEFLKMDKEYIAVFRLGKESDTYDRDGVIKENLVTKIPTLEEIKKCLATFEGEFEQIPPPYSNKRIKGQRARDLIRKGLAVILKPQKIKIYQIEILDYKFPELKIKVSCSSGTYIRSLAHDFGLKIKTGAYVEKLTRTKIGEYQLKEAIDLSLLNKDNWQDFLKKLDNAVIRSKM